MTEQPSELRPAAERLLALLAASKAAIGDEDPAELTEIILAFCEFSRALIARYELKVVPFQIRDDIETLGDLAAEFGSDYAAAWARVQEWLTELEKGN